MPDFTPEEIARLRELSWVSGRTDDQLKSFGVKLEDVRLLSRRVQELDLDDYHSADELMRFTVRRLEEELRAAREYLKDQLEFTRIAELQVKEATHALAATKALIDGGMYVSSSEVNIRWDELETEFRMQGFLPIEDEPPALEEPPPPTPETPLPPELVAQLSVKGQAEHAAPEAADQPRETRWDAKTREREPMTPEQQDAAMLAALKVAAGDKPEIQVSTAVLAAASGVPNGSTLTSLRRMESAGLIEIIGDKPEKGAPRPNIYRFKTPEGEAKTSSEPPEAPADPVTEIVEKVAEAQPDVAPTALGEAFIKAAETVKKSGAPKKSDDRPVRDRILHTLKSVACTTSGLASMLDVKELAVCQALEAMKHEGVVTSDEMPEAGRRAQLWRLPVAELSPS